MKKERLKKTVKGTRIAIDVILVLIGIALVGFLGWLGYSIYAWLGVTV